MTNLEALKGKLDYPLSDNTFKVALADRGLTDSDTYAKGQPFDLAYADCIVSIITKGKISEGSFSLSPSDVKELSKIANGIYGQYGVTSPIQRPKATFRQPW